MTDEQFENLDFAGACNQSREDLRKITEANVAEGVPRLTFGDEDEAVSFFLRTLLTAVHWQLNTPTGLRPVDMSVVLERLAVMLHPAGCRGCMAKIIEGGSERYGSPITRFLLALFEASDDDLSEEEQGEKLAVIVTAILAADERNDEDGLGGEVTPSQEAILRTLREEQKVAADLEAVGLGQQRPGAGFKSFKRVTVIPMSLITEGSAFAVPTPQYPLVPGSATPDETLVGFGGGGHVPDEAEAQMAIATGAVVIDKPLPPGGLSSGRDIGPYTRPWQPSDGFGPARLIILTKDEAVGILLSLHERGISGDDFTAGVLQGYLDEVITNRIEAYSDGGGILDPSPARAGGDEVVKDLDDLTPERLQRVAAILEGIPPVAPQGDEAGDDYEIA